MCVCVERETVFVKTRTFKDVHPGLETYHDNPVIRMCRCQGATQTEVF